MHTVLLKSKARKFIRRQSEKIPEQLLDAIDTLKTSPLSGQSITLKGNQGRRRIRSGDYRIVYRVDSQKKIVSVLRIGHRREVYRRLD